MKKKENLEDKGKIRKKMKSVRKDKRREWGRRRRSGRISAWGSETVFWRYLEEMKKIQINKQTQKQVSNQKKEKRKSEKHENELWPQKIINEQMRNVNGPPIQMSKVNQSKRKEMKMQKSVKKCKKKWFFNVVMVSDVKTISSPQI